MELMEPSTALFKPSLTYDWFNEVVLAIESLTPLNHDIAREYLCVAEHFIRNADPEKQPWSRQIRSVHIKKSTACAQPSGKAASELHFPESILSQIECPKEVLTVSHEHQDVLRIGRYALRKLTGDYDNLKPTTEKSAEFCAILCEIYDLLIYFEKTSHHPYTLQRLAKLTKRKLDVNRTLLEHLERDVGSRQERRAADMNIVRLYMDLLENKQEQFERSASGNLSPRLLQKMAFFCTKGIQTCQRCLANVGVDKWGSNMHDDNALKPLEDRVYAARACYFLARFYNKFFTPNRTEQLEYTKRAIKTYECMIKATTLGPEIGQHLKSELHVAIDTLDLLQRQVEKMEETY